MGRAKGLNPDQLEEQLCYVMEVTRTADVAHRLIKNLSKGYQQRVGIAQALLGDPEVIILDEPTVGLDPKQIIEIRSLIQTLGRDRTVILSSHILSEVQAVCQTILILSKGKLVACDTPENLERRFAGTTTVALTAQADTEEVRRLLAFLPGASRLEFRPVGEDKCQVTLETDWDEDVLCRDIFFLFSRAQLPLLRLTTARAGLEEIFLELTQDTADPLSAPEEEAVQGEADTQETLGEEEDAE